MVQKVFSVNSSSTLQRLCFMKLFLQIIVLYATLILSGNAVQLQLVHNTTVGSGKFCVTVGNASQIPPGSTRDMKKYWVTSPKIVLQMFVKAKLRDVFVAKTTAVEFNSSDLKYGQHLILFYNTNTDKNIHTLSVSMDAVHTEPTFQGKTYRSTNSDFSIIKIFAKGPLVFKWNEYCEEATIPSAGTTMSITTSTTPTKRWPQYSSTTIPSVTLNISKAQLDLTSIPPNARTSSIRSSTVLILVLVCPIVIPVILMTSICIFLVIRKYKQRVKIPQKTEQEMLRDSKKEPYQEQQPCAESNVDTNLVH